MEPINYKETSENYFVPEWETRTERRTRRIEMIAVGSFIAIFLVILLAGVVYDFLNY